jgi:hypothetical protein
MRIPAASPDPIKGGGEGSGPDIEGGWGPGLPMQDLDDKSLSHASPPRRDPRRDRWVPVGARPPRLPVPGWTDGPPARAVRELPSLPPTVGTGPSGRSRPHSVHFQSTWGSTFSPRGPPRAVHIRLWHSTPDGVNHAELCDGHVEIHGPKVIRIKYGGSLGGRSRRFMGRPLRPAIGVKSLLGLLPMSREARGGRR